MFGDIRPLAPELKLRENTFYRAVYCGLCRSMGRACGQRSRIFLSYDLTFLALFRMAATGSTPTIRPRRCFVHPLRKRPMADPDEQLLFCSRAGVLLTWQKLRDDRADEHGWKRLRAIAGMAILRRGRKKAARALPGLEDRIRYHLTRLSELETAGCPSIDQTAAVFGDLMEELAAWDLEGTARRLTAAAGSAVGRWIYRMDAQDDYAEDAKKQRYNPLLLGFPAPLSEADRDLLRVAMMSDLQDLAGAYDLLDLQNSPPDAAAWANLTGVLENLLFLGMPDAVRKVVEGSRPDHKTAF